ncbi:hypothetical protein C1280_36985 [Gemmata obscuriglobus]|uniref:Carboxypeptidase regulatory-like domain-containing protein n=2 Tax=Gemmata obscuriglobus TaxID=114 RepID=A0A2Z3HKM5_9BACT|nr:hypothetical protein C1280_36985 [Gemmata obscuriglobus]
MTPVHGTVLYQNKPAARVQVVFHPLFDVGPRKFAPSAVTDGAGRFQLGSASTSDGAPVGEYAVTFALYDTSKNPDEGDIKVDRWKGKYSDPAKSTFKVQIRDGDNALPPFKLD